MCLIGDTTIEQNGISGCHFDGIALPRSWQILLCKHGQLAQERYDVATPSSFCVRRQGPPQDAGRHAPRDVHSREGRQSVGLGTPAGGHRDRPDHPGAARNLGTGLSGPGAHPGPDTPAYRGVPASELAPYRSDVGPRPPVLRRLRCRSGRRWGARRRPSCRRRKDARLLLLRAARLCCGRPGPGGSTPGSGPDSWRRPGPGRPFPPTPRHPEGRMAWPRPPHLRTREKPVAYRVFIFAVIFMFFDVPSSSVIKLKYTQAHRGPGGRCSRRYRAMSRRRCTAVPRPSRSPWSRLG